MKKIFLLSVVAFLFLNAEAQTTIVKRIQYDVQIKGEAQNEPISLNNITASTRLDFLNSLLESVKKGETKTYSLHHVNSVPVYTELKKDVVLEQFNFEKEYVIQLPNPMGDPDDPFDVIDTIITEMIEITSIRISHIRFIERWEEDANGFIVKTIESFAPIFIDSISKWNIETNNYELTPNMIPLFWVKEIGMKKASWTINMLSETQIRNEVSDSNWFVSNVEPPYRIKWMSRVFENTKTGKVKAYNYYDSITSLSQGAVDSAFFYYIDVFVYDDELWEENLVSVKYEIQPSEIIKLMFYEIWIIDSKKGFRKEVVAYAPKYLSNEEIEWGLFWIKNQPNSP